MLSLIVAVSFVFGLALGLQDLKQFFILVGFVFSMVNPLAFLITFIGSAAAYWAYRHLQSKRKSQYVARRRY